MSTFLCSGLADLPSVAVHARFKRMREVAEWRGVAVEQSTHPQNFTGFEPQYQVPHLRGKLVGEGSPEARGCKVCHAGRN